MTMLTIRKLEQLWVSSVRVKTYSFMISTKLTLTNVFTQQTLTNEEVWRHMRDQKHMRNF